MPSSVGWLDYSEEHRQRMREVIDLFKDEDTLDEIGIGSIRDAFSDLLFPGLSTVQTRAKYFLFIPWVYRRIEDERLSSARAGQAARRYLTDLIFALERGGAAANDGIIGWDARDNLQRLPSAVYWAGLGGFGIRLFHGSAEEYHRSLDSYYQRLKHHSQSEGDEVSEKLHPNWTSNLPQTPSDLWEEASMTLDPQESQFLQERMTLRRPDSLLARYLAHRDADFSDAPTPWDHPAALDLAEPTRSWIHHARLFSEVIQGAALGYNLMLAEKAKKIGMSLGDTDLVEHYRNRLAVWVAGLETREADLSNWDLQEFWQEVGKANARVPFTTRAFVQRWIQSTRASAQQTASLPNDLRALIEDRERRLKGGRARLTSHRALELWNGSSGTALLTYRWPTARTMLRDILG